MNDDATQFSYFRDNELTQLADTTVYDESGDDSKALDEGTIFLNKYKILKVLGEGSFSLIYLLEAVDASKKLLVAKEFFPKGFVTRNQNNEVILKTSLSEKEIENYHFMKDIFIGEAQNLVKVSKRAHPNVLNFFALEENVNNTMYLITDYEEGMTLKAYVKERKKEHKGKLTNQEIKGIATGLLNGLSHIHKVNVYHQDIKLENILIRQDQYPLLLDFGASIILYDKKQKKYFNATTPRYAAPEQVDLAQPPKIDQRTDIYELGVLLYKLITDEFPPKASERLKAEEEHKDSYIPLEVQKPYGYDLNVLKAVDRALELEQENRFQNTDDFKKALLHKKSFMNFSQVGLALLVPILLGLLYMVWPESKGTAKLNIEQKKYFVYSDGNKIPLSEEKTILLSAGKHQLTIIKDGYIPHEVNVTIKANSIVNVSGKLAPLNHTIILGSNISSASFMVNGRSLTSDRFEGQAGSKYTITVSAPNYTTEVSEVDYIEFYKNDFEYYKELKPAQTKVKIRVDRPFELGESTITVNGKKLHGNSMIAKYNESYMIDIENPYYKKVHLERRYNELNKNPELNIALKEGYGEIILKGLPEGVTIEVYKKYLNETKHVNSQFVYTNKEYRSKIPAFDKIYIKLLKEGYETLETPIVDIQKDRKYIETYALTKKAIKKKKVVEKKEIEKPLEKVKPIVVDTITKETKKQNSIKELVPKEQIDKISKSEISSTGVEEKQPLIVQKDKSVEKVKPIVVDTITKETKKQNSIKELVPKEQIDKISKNEISSMGVEEKQPLIAQKDKSIEKEKITNNMLDKDKEVINTVIKKPVVLKTESTKPTILKEKVKKNKKVKTVKYKIKRGDTLFSIAHANRTTTEEVKRQNNLKKGEILKLGRVLDVPVGTYVAKKKEEKIKNNPKTKKIIKKKTKTKTKKKRIKKPRKKHNKKKTTSGYVWYCVAGEHGSETWSAKRSTRKEAYAAALRKCRRGKNNFCSVSSCYILGGS